MRLAATVTLIQVISVAEVPGERLGKTLLRASRLSLNSNKDQYHKKKHKGRPLAKKRKGNLVPLRYPHLRGQD